MKSDGTVMVEILIDSEGRVAHAHVIQSIPHLDGLALECVYQWTFHPARKDGHPVPALANAPIIFRKEGYVAPIEPHRKQRSPAPAMAPGAKETGGISGLHFDSQGADFTLWFSTFDNEVYGNWVVPAATLRFRENGKLEHVNFEFTVERSGGAAPFDEAAEAALTKSHFAALPADYLAPRVTMTVSFVYTKR